jgi:hypothetical protein
MLPTEDLFVHCYTLVDDLIRDGQVVIPPRPGPTPGCSDGEVLAIVLVRHLCHRRSESQTSGSRLSVRVEAPPRQTIL